VSGIVLLVIIGVLVAWLVSKGRGKMKLPFSGKNWLWVIIVVVVVLAIAYGASGHVSNN
jgi:drug/metabolite transporter (DMT)-like permease